MPAFCEDDSREADYVGSLPYLNEDVLEDSGISPQANDNLHLYTSYHTWQMAMGSVNNIPTPWYTQGQDATDSQVYAVNFEVRPGDAAYLSTAPIDLLSLSRISTTSYSVLSFTSQYHDNPAYVFGATLYSYLAIADNQLPTTPYFPTSWVLMSGGQQLGVRCENGGVSNIYTLRPGCPVFIPGNVPIRLRIVLADDVEYLDPKGAGVFGFWTKDTSVSIPSWVSTHEEWRNRYMEFEGYFKSDILFGGSVSPVYLELSKISSRQNPGSITFLSCELSLIDDEQSKIVDAVNKQIDNDNRLQQEQQNREDEAQKDAEDSISSAISGADDTLSGPLDMIKAVEQLGSSLTDALKNSEDYTFHFPGVKGPFLPGGKMVEIVSEQDVDLSFLHDKFGLIMDAIGLVCLGLCGWKALDYLYRLIQTILGAREEGGVDG